jgi:Uma2 family endonuclease
VDLGPLLACLVTTAPPCDGQPISVEEFDALPPFELDRLEIEDGRLLVMNQPTGRHLVATQRVAYQLNDQLPVHLEAMPAFEAELAEPSPRRVPDVVVCTEEATDQQRVRADQILLAVEIFSPGESTARDYIKKPIEYAASGIPLSWVIDIQENPHSLTVYTLDDSGQYHFSSLITGSYTGMVGGHEVTIDLDALTGPRRKRN